MRRLHGRIMTRREGLPIPTPRYGSGTPDTFIVSRTCQAKIVTISAFSSASTGSQPSSSGRLFCQRSVQYFSQSSGPPCARSTVGTLSPWHPGDVEGMERCCVKNRLLALSCGPHFPVSTTEPTHQHWICGNLDTDD